MPPSLIPPLPPIACPLLCLNGNDSAAATGAPPRATGRAFAQTAPASAACTANVGITDGHRYAGTGSHSQRFPSARRHLYRHLLALPYLHHLLCWHGGHPRNRANTTAIAPRTAPVPALLPALPYRPLDIPRFLTSPTSSVCHTDSWPTIPALQCPRAQALVLLACEPSTLPITPIHLYFMWLLVAVARAGFA